MIRLKGLNKSLDPFPRLKSGAEGVKNAFKNILKISKKVKQKNIKKPLEKAVFLLLDTIETFRAIILALFVAKKIPS